MACYVSTAIVGEEMEFMMYDFYDRITMLRNG